MSRASGFGWALRSALWLLLGGWLGAWAFFAFAVAPLAFGVLPGVDVAGSVVGPLLTILHLYGLFAGLALAGLAFALARGPLLILIPLGLCLLCAISHFGVTAAIESVRPSTLSAISDSAAAAQFASLHQISRTLYAVVGLGTLALVILHARCDTKPPKSPKTA